MSTGLGRDATTSELIGRQDGDVLPFGHETRVVELRRLPVKRTVPMPQGGLGAGWVVLKRFTSPDDPACGVIEGRQQNGGSVPEGYRSWMEVVLPDALIEVEEYEDRPDANRSARVYDDRGARR